MIRVRVHEDLLKTALPPYVRASERECREAQANVVSPEETGTWENQKWWHEMLPKHDKGLRDGYGKLRDPHWHSVAKAHMEVGLIGSRQQFKEIPSCLPDEIRDPPVHNITRIALDKDGTDEQLLICARNGEKVLFTRLGPIWAWNGVYTQVVDEGVMEIENPPFITQYEVFARASKMVLEIQAVENCVRDFFGRLNHDKNVENLILSYDGYPTKTEKNQAEERRQALMRSITRPLIPYQLPTSQKKPSTSSGCVVS